VCESFLPKDRMTATVAKHTHPFDGFAASDYSFLPR
jgi:hypothetical protein